MTVSQIQKGYILYIGAGAVAAGGIISLFRSLPVIWSGLKGGLADLRRSGAGSNDNAPRTDQDLSMKLVLGGIIALIIVIMVVPQLNLRFNILGALLIIAFGFLFVTVSSRLTGEVGSSSNPISGMTVDRAALLRHCAFDRRHSLYRCFEWRHDVSGFKDRIPRGRYAEVSADRNPGGSVDFSACTRTNSAGHESVGQCLRAGRSE
jgi:hypothetical protein